MGNWGTTQTKWNAVECCKQKEWYVWIIWKDVSEMWDKKEIEWLNKWVNKGMYFID